MTKNAVRLPALLLFGVALAIGLYVATGPATAAPPEQSASQAEHARIVEFWTPERIAAAVPRDLVVDGRFAPGTLAKPDGVGNGNGGGKKGGGGDTGDTSTAVTGATWNSAGTVKSTTGKVLFTLGFTYYVCSGTVVDDGADAGSLVLTAGHCVFDEASNTWATNWMFIPDFASGGDLLTCAGTRYGCWTAEAYSTTLAWTNGDLNADYAFAVMRLGGLDGATELDIAVGSQAIAFNQAHPTDVYAFGYPHASPYDGNDLVYCAGTDAPDTWGGSDDYGLHCDMTGGSSGGAWYTDFDEGTGTGTLTSVNSFHYVRGPASKNMYGPYFDNLTERTYQAARDIVVDEDFWTLQVAVVY
jgi:hypothetical protein